jgi:hypothetical protein
VVDGLTTYYLADIAKVDPKTVWYWLKPYGIPTRPRGHNHVKNHVFAFWLHGRKNPFAGRRHTEEYKKKASEIAIAEGRVPFDPAIGPPLKGKRGSEVPTWKGGVTPERQAFYSSAEWKVAVKAVWKRDNATCQRCGKRSQRGERFAFDIHHIVTFAYAPLRAKPSNLVLLCEDCHYWIHSNENVDNLFIKETSCVAG